MGLATQETSEVLLQRQSHGHEYHLARDRKPRCWRHSHDRIRYILFSQYFEMHNNSFLKADGVVRLYRNYDPSAQQGPVQTVSAFRGLTEVIQMKKGSGIIMDWKQFSGSLLVGGDSRVIRVWDAHTETHVLVSPPLYNIKLSFSVLISLSFRQDLETKADSPVTSMMFDHGISSTFVASFADGEVKVFDRRMEEENAVVRYYSDHTSWVQNVRWHPTFPGQFLSAR